MKYFLFGVIACLGVVTGVVATYIWTEEIDDKIVSGDAYGFSIGESKHATYEKAPNALGSLGPGNTAIFIRVHSDDETAKFLATASGHPVLVQTYLNDIGYEQFANKDQWKFFFHGSYLDSISLTFCDEKLCEIYRNRRLFERL